MDNDEDDGDSEDKKTLLAITSAFRQQADIVQQLFNFINEVFSLDVLTPTVIVNFPELGGMLERGMILSENQYLRSSMSERIKNILLALHSSSQTAAADGSQLVVASPNDSCFAKTLQILLSSLVERSKDPLYEGRVSNFYLHVCSVLEVLEQKDLEALQSQVLHLIEQLPKDIIERQTKEVGSSDTDILLGGLMNVLMHLLRRFPVFKK